VIGDNDYYVTKAKMRAFIASSFCRAHFQGVKVVPEKIIGMSVEEFNEHLRRTFYERYDVTVSQYLKYYRKRLLCIDHIVPIRLANSAEDVVRLCNYSNLQLLIASDNVGKEKGRDINKNHFDLKSQFIIDDFFATREAIT
jgi:hypothetical protein